MIIDDNYIDRYIAQTTIKKAGFANDIISFDGALQAFQYLKEQKDNSEQLPDVIFLDINMPEFTGFDFLSWFNELVPVDQQKCRIVMLSSSLNEIDHNRAMSFKQVIRFLNKPLKKDILQEILA